MNLSFGKWGLTIDLDGGRIKELARKGQKIFGTYNRIDGKEGNTHLCVPSFDREGSEKYGLPFHGLVRNSLWTIDGQSEDTLSLSIITKATATYPASLKVTQTFTLNDVFTHSIGISHLSGNPVPVNCGVHYYWNTPQGWDNTQINESNSKTNIETNGYVTLSEHNSIIFPHAAYQLTSHGFHNAVTWTSFKNEGKKKIYSNDFCCIEPVVGWPDYFGSKESMLNPGETVSASIVLKKVA